MKIKQIELKNVDIDKLNPDEVFICDLDNYNLMDLYFERISDVLDDLRKNKTIVFFKAEKEVKDDEK